MSSLVVIIEAISLVLDGLDGKAGVGELVEARLLCGGRIDDGAVRVSVLFGGGGGGFSIGDGGAHLGDKISMTITLFGGDHAVKVAGSGGVEDVGGLVGLGDIFVADGGVGAISDRVAFSINDVSKKGKAVGGFFLGDVAGAGLFDGLGGSDEDGGFALASIPEALVRLEVVANDGRKISLHGLVFF